MKEGSISMDILSYEGYIREAHMLAKRWTFGLD
jgi:hypothetical protein